MAEISTVIAKLKKKAGAKFRARETGAVALVEIAPGAVPALANMLLSEGAAFDSAFISPAKGREFTVHYIFAFRPFRKMVVLAATGKRFRSVSEFIPAAVWDERKMRDLAGVELDGLEDTRPLIIHPEAGAPAKYPLAPKSSKSPRDIPKQYPMPGTDEEGEFEISVGPVHAGIIEPGHFRFQVVGERINKLETRMFFLHRGVEKVAEGKSLKDGIVLAEQIAGDESVANAVAYCQAVEALGGIRVPERARLLRVVLLELERIYSHLADLGGMAMDVGFYQSSSRFMLLREEAMRMNARLTGSRFLKGVSAIGGLSRDFDAKELAAVFSHLQAFNKNFVLLNKMALASSTFLDRAFMTGVLRPEQGARLSAVGPVARASGITCDARKWLPYAAYGDIGFYEVTGENGDVLSRYYVKSDEVRESIGMVMAAIIELGKMPGPVRAPMPAPSALANKLGFGWAEAPRGACTIMVSTDSAGRIGRFACRTASFRNWRAIEKTIETIIMPDFPLVNKSFNLAYAGNDL